MGNKKKFHGGLKLLSSLLFMLLFVNLSTTCKAYTIYNGAPQLKNSEMSEIVDILDWENYVSGDVISGFTESFNRWARLTAQVEDFSIQNILFFRLNTTGTIGWTLVNGTAGSFSYAYLNSNNSYDSYISPNTNYGTIPMSSFSNWTYNSSGDPNGTVRGNLSYWRISYNSPSTVSQQNGVVSIDTRNINNVNQQVIITESTGGNAYSLYIPNLLALSQTHVVYAYTQTFGRNSYFLTNYLILENESLTPTPTPTTTPTPTPSGGGGGSTDLTDTNNKIDDVKDSVDDLKNEVISFSDSIINQISGDNQAIINELTEVPESGDFNSFSSGDILDSLDMEETIDPYENFWATFINGLNTALTCPNNTTYDIEIFGENYTIDSADWAIDYPQPLKYILVIACTIGIVFAELKMWRKIIIAINTGNLLNLAISYSNDDITDLF